MAIKLRKVDESDETFGTIISAIQWKLSRQTKYFLALEALCFGVGFGIDVFPNIISGSKTQTSGLTIPCK